MSETRIMETPGIAVREHDPGPFDFAGSVTLKTLALHIGRIETNAAQVLSAVAERVKDYRDISRYEGRTDAAKKDRALLRKEKDALTEMRKDIEARWNSPLEAFRTTAKQISAAYDEAIDGIDSMVKAGEAREKQEKYEVLKGYFTGKACSLVPFDRLFKSQWLNKTYKLTDSKAEIDAAVAEVYENIKVLEGIAEHGMTAKALYLETLDMAAALRKVETLKLNGEKLAQEQLERADREREQRITRNRAELEEEQSAAGQEERIRSLAAEALDLGVFSPDAEQRNPPRLCEITLKFRGTTEKLYALRKYMSDNGIAYERIG